MSASPALVGFATALSLILAIGAQNAFVLRQGLMQRHVFPLCLLCAVSDAILIAAGVAGFGAIATALPAFPTIMSLAGAAFLAVYGALRLRAAVAGTSSLAGNGGGGTLTATLLTGAAFTWLNPHVYLDTLVLVGAVSTQFEDGGQKLAFGIGAVSASFVFFFSLGYGARRLGPIMARPGAWRWLDTGIGLTMLALAVGLLRSIA